MMHSPHDDSFLEANEPQLGGGKGTGDKLTGMYDLVEQVQYLYVEVVKARDLPVKDVTGSCDPYAEVRLGNYEGTTCYFEKKSNPEWNQVFVVSRDKIQASHVLEVTVKDKDFVKDKDSVKDDFMGWVVFDLTEVPKSVPPDGLLVAQWFKLENRKGDRSKGELMLAVWWGTQADDAFPAAWHLDDASVGEADGLANIRSKVYHSPKLWYLRVGVIGVQDLVPSDITKNPEVFVKATIGDQTLRTSISMSMPINPTWNEELMFVAEEPFEENLILSVEDRSTPNKKKILGRCPIHLLSVERRVEYKAINTRWFDLEMDDNDEEKKKEIKCAGRIHTRICLEGGYNVPYEPHYYPSDLRPTAKELWKKSIGVLEVGILSAHGLIPMKTKYGRATTDAYCVAKYGRKWVRTRTITNSVSPIWNEQYTWEVFDPCTVMTIGVFHNRHLQGGGASDSRMGRVRIRISTLETDRAYTHAYPLLVLHPSGVKKMGEIHLAVRFTCSSLLNMMHMYSQPLLPKMNYIHPLTLSQLNSLRHQAMQIVSTRLSQAEPPLRKEVVDYMLDVDSDLWSLRRSKANFFRIMAVLAGLIPSSKWFDGIRNWRNPIATVLVHILFIILVLYPGFILPSVFIYPFLIGVWNFRWRPRRPPHVDTRLSYADNAHPDELDEEFDTFPTSRPSGVVRMRYDRLRSISGRLQTVAGDLATEGERLLSLLSWRDPIATTLFIIFCLIAAIVLYVKPFYVVVIHTGFTLLNHPRFQHNLPLVPYNFFRRLPSRIECFI